MRSATPSTDTTRSAEPLPADVETGRDDGVLDSLGKAVAAPVTGAAEAEEPGHGGGQRLVKPG